MKKNFIILILITTLALCTVITHNKNEVDNTLEKITLAEVTHSIFYAPLYVAIENGYFEDYGIEVDLILTSGADKVSAAVISGDADVGLAGPESAIYIYQGGNNDYLEVFSGLTKRDGQFIIGREENDNFTLDDLYGKEILTGRDTGMPALNFFNALDNNNIDSGKININTSVEFSALAGTFIGGTGDYVNLFEPTATLLVNQGVGYIVASVGELSGEVPYTAFYSKKSYIDENEEILKNFTKAINKGLMYIRNTSGSKIAETIQNQFIDQDTSELYLMIERYKESDVWLTTPFIDEDIFNNLEYFLEKYELTDNTSTYEYVVNNLYE